MRVGGHAHFELCRNKDILLNEKPWAARRLRGLDDQKTQKRIKPNLLVGSNFIIVGWHQVVAAKNEGYKIINPKLCPKPAGPKVSRVIQSDESVSANETKNEDE